MIQLRFQLALKCLIALGLVGAGYCATARSFAAALATNDPVSALAISSGDARVMAGAAQVMMDRAQTIDERRQASLLARRAVMRDGTAVTAAITLGFAAAFVDDERLGESWFDYSERLSRREPRAQLYFIEKSVQEGNVGKALHHYDVALRTAGEGTKSILFPILRAAISDQPVRRELAQTLAGRPLWSGYFLTDLVYNGPDFEAAAQLLTEARRLKVPIAPVLHEILIDRLVAHGGTSVAWRYYTALHQGADRVMIRNGNFTSDQAGNSSFDWQLTSSSGISANLGANDNDQTLDYQLSSAVGGTVARQMTLLPAGKYRLESVLITSSQSKDVGPYWELKCAAGQPIGTLQMGGPMTTAQRFSVDLVVPANCGVQLLSLIVRASDDVQGATGQIASVSLSQIQAK